MSIPSAASSALPSGSGRGFASTPTKEGRRRRYAIVGTGSRHELYQDAIEVEYAAFAELVALCDSNPGRVEIARQRSKTNGAKVPPRLMLRGRL